jgi:hypothetical protein
MGPQRGRAAGVRIEVGQPLAHHLDHRVGVE